MLRSDHERGRPTANRAASNVSNLDIDSVPRCTHCHRPLTRPESIDLGYGWRCAQREAA